MRALYVFEKFSDDTDPIEDMEIGMLQEIRDWLNKENKRNYWNYVNDHDTEKVLIACIHAHKDEFIEYLINNKDDYDKTDIMSTLLFYEKKVGDYIHFIDEIIKKGGYFKELSQKVRYIEQGGKLISLTDTEKLLLACIIGNFKDFKKSIDNNVKLTMGMINHLFIRNYRYRDNHGLIGQDEKEKIKDYLRNNLDNLEKLVTKGTISKIDKIKRFLGVSESEGVRNYPRGYKIYRILKRAAEEGYDSHSDITRFIYELSYGPNTFNPLVNSSYWSTNFAKMIHPNVRKGSDGIFRITPVGEIKLKTLKRKFGNMKVNAYL